MATTNDDNPSCISFLGYARYRELIMREKQDAEKDNRVSAKHSALAHWRVLVIVATPDLPQGGSGDQKPPKRRPWRGTPLGVQRRRISDEEADVRGETRRVRAPAGRGRHELHPGRARGRRLETHRQGVAQRQDARHGKERETPGGPVSFHHGQTQAPPSAPPEPGGAHPDRGPSASGRFDPRHRPPAGPRPRHGRPRGRAQQESPSPAVTNPAAPGRRPRTGSNAPNRARRPRTRDCGTRSPPGCAGIGARSR